jgi:hypothetical protein
MVAFHGQLTALFQTSLFHPLSAPGMFSALNLTKPLQALATQQLGIVGIAPTHRAMDLKSA